MLKLGLQRFFGYWETFISWVIIERLTESESILPKGRIEVHFRTRLQPYLKSVPLTNTIQGDIFTQIIYTLLT